MTKQEKYKLKQEIKELICSDCDFLRRGICTNEVSECSSDHEADKFVKWLEMNNYYQIQTGDNGLISNDYICNHSIVCGGYSNRGICEDSETCYGIEEHKISCKAQKALDDKYLEESCNILKEYYNKTVDQYTKEIEELSAENGKLQNRIKELDGLC